jgi:outer membrane protein assembly factor BamB
VYVSTYDGYVYALSASSDAKLWRNKVGLGGITSSAVANGVVYVSESNGHVYALSARAGDILWSNPTRGTYLNSSPIVVNGVVYVNSIDLYAFGLK